MADHALPEAVRAGDLTRASDLLRAGRIPTPGIRSATQPPFPGHTPLMEAVLYKRPAMVEFLLDRGADRRRLLARPRRDGAGVHRGRRTARPARPGRPRPARHSPRVRLPGSGQFAY